MLDLLWACIPVVIMIAIYIRWTKDKVTLFYALARMLIQLILIGYVLTYIFNFRLSLSGDTYTLCHACGSKHHLPASYAKERECTLHESVYLHHTRWTLYLSDDYFGVLNLNPWYEAKFLIPLAGMIFANSMNVVSIAAERYESEMQRSASYEQA